MAANPKQPSRFRNFLRKIFPFLTRRQQKKVIAEAKSSNLPVPPSPPPPTREPPGRDGATVPPRGPTVAEILERERRIQELRRVEESAKAERKTLEAPNAAMMPPIRAFGDLKERKGFVYSTWFKAFGTFGDLRDAGDSPPLLGEMEELEDFDVPAAFYSSGILGKVKWDGNISRETLIDRLNSAASWNPQDFRDVYPKWEYRYYVAEQVGDVVVQIFEHKARQPLDARSKERGFQSS